MVHKFKEVGRISQINYLNYEERLNIMNKIH